MKKLLTLLLLLAASFAFAQDGYKLSESEYQSYKEKVNNLSEQQATALAGELAAASPIDYTYFRTNTRKTGMNVIYSRTDLTPEEQAKQEETGCVRCLMITFRRSGDNYNLFQLTGTYDELFPIWKGVFLTSSQYDEAKDNFRQRDIVSRTTGTDIRMQKSGDVWRIINATR